MSQILKQVRGLALVYFNIRNRLGEAVLSGEFWSQEVIQLAGDGIPRTAGHPSHYRLRWKGYIPNEEGWIDSNVNTLRATNDGDLDLDREVYNPPQYEPMGEWLRHIRGRLDHEWTPDYLTRAYLEILTAAPHQLELKLIDVEESSLIFPAHLRLGEMGETLRVPRQPIGTRFGTGDIYEPTRVRPTTDLDAVYHCSCQLFDCEMPLMAYQGPYQ